MTSPNCFECPSLLSSGEAAVFFGKSVGGPMCAVTGRPIGLPAKNDTRRRSGEAMAANCTHFGLARPEAANWQGVRMNVALPDVEIVRNNPRSQQELVRSCNTCAHFVREDVVAKELGFGAALCSARGDLVMSNRFTFTARECDDKSIALSAGVRTDVRGVVMLPEYTIGQPQSSDPVARHLRDKANFVDPTEYETDRPVSEEHWDSGIRAWRGVADPETGNEIFLPIYRGDFFTKEELSKVPQTGDDEHPEDYIDHGGYIYKIGVLWTELDETPGIWGQAGTGKSELFRHLAWLMQLPYERISITGSTELDDLAGKMHYSPEKGTYWQDGRMVSAWSKPSVLCVDEPNTGPADVWQFLRPMTDNSKQLVLDQNNGERRPRHEACYLGLAMNPAWDVKNVGTHVVGDADVNRLMHISIPLPPAALEREIITTRCERDGYQIPRSTLDTIMRIAEDIRSLCEEDAIPITWAVRPQLKVARATRWFDLTTCYRLAVADFLDPDAERQVMNVVSSHVE